jgi:hypothetical protein
MADDKDARALLAHQLGTYYTLRVVLACIAFALPLVVAAAGWLQCKHPPQLLAGSLSAYYHRTALSEFLTARDFFVGGLLAAAACLYAYKGFSTKENIALNMAAGFAIGVALLPTSHGALAGNAMRASESCVAFMGAGYQDSKIRPILHAASAIFFFLCLAYVSIRRCRDTLRLLNDEVKREWFNRAYVLAGTAMALSPVVAALIALIADTPHPIFIFAIETVGVWAFGLYWTLKTLEMRETQLDARVATGQVERATVPSSPPTKTLDRVLRKIQVGGSDSVERIVPVNHSAF